MAAYNCSDPPSLSKGYFVIAKPYYVDGDQVFYYCQLTYFLQGNPIRECDGDTGNWTGSAPTCSAITTTSTTEAPVNEWIYMSISLSSFLALVFVCIVGVVILKYCYILCRQKTRVKDDEEEVETGCCYTCCIHCISFGCRGCFSKRNISPRPTPQPPSPKPSLRSVSIQAGSSPSTLKLEEAVTAKKVAKELRNYWKPHVHDIRQNNQSTH